MVCRHGDTHQLTNLSTYHYDGTQLNIIAPSNVQSSNEQLNSSLAAFDRNPILENCNLKFVNDENKYVNG